MKETIFEIIRKFNLALITAAMISGASYSAEPVRLELYTDGFPPLQVEVDGKAKGYVVEFVEALIKEASKDIPEISGNINFVPWKRAIRASQSRPNVLLFSISRTPSREGKYHWIGEVSPYEVTLYRHIQGPKVQPKTIADLIDYRFGVQAGGSFDEYIKENGATDILAVTYGRRTIKLLKANRIDFAPLVASSFYYRMEQYGENPNDYLSVLKIDELSKQLWLVASKGTSQEIINALTRSYQTLTKDGVLKRLIEAYHPSSDIMKKYREIKQKERQE